MKQAFTILIIMLMVTGNIYSQQQVTVSGVIRDTTGAPLSDASVHIVCNNFDFTVISRQDGSFFFNLKQHEIFKLEITMKGYSLLNRVCKTPSYSSSLNLPPFILHQLFQELETVTVDYLRPIIIREDTIEYRASAYPVRAGDELERLLKLLPGMITDTGGNILIQGKRISRIQINGRDYVGGDVLTALRNLPSDIIDKIQVIDDYGDKARLTGVKSGDPNKVVNLILKNSKKNGLVSNLEAGIGNENKYLGRAYSSAFIGDRQITLNSKFVNNNPGGNVYEKLAAAGYSDRWTKKLSGNGALSFWGNDQTVLSDSRTATFLPGITQDLRQTHALSGQNDNLNFSNTLLYQPRVNSLLRIGTTFAINHNSQNSSLASTIVENNTGSLKTTTANLQSQSSLHGFSAGSNLYFEKKSPGSGNRFSIEASCLFSAQKRYQYNIDSASIVLDSQLTNSRQVYAIQSSNYRKDLTANLSYFAALGQRSFLELVYSFKFSSSKDNRSTLFPGSTTSDLEAIDSLSNNYLLQNTTNTFHLGYLGHLSLLNFSVGLTALSTIQNGKGADKTPNLVYRYFDLLPSAELSYAFSQNKKVYFNYKTNSLSPSQQQLRPVSDISNLQYPVEGNPLLKPAYNQTIKVRYEQFFIKPARPFGFEFGFRYNTTSDMVIETYLYPKDSSNIIQKTTYQNRNGFNTVDADYRIEMQPFSRVKLILDGSISKSQAGNSVNNSFFKTSSIVLIQGFTANLNIPAMLELMAGASYSKAFTRYSPVTVPSTRFSSISWVLSNRHTFFKSWRVIYTTRQTFTSNTNDRLVANPILTDLQIKRDFLRNNQASLAFSINNLFNHGAGITQSISATSLTQNEIHLLHRFYIVSLILKFEKFQQ